MDSRSFNKVFISFENRDLKYKKTLDDILGRKYINKSGGDWEIPNSTDQDETIYKIRDNFIADSTVCLVLVGACTWQKKHIDWEISASIRGSIKKKRIGLMGILLPNHPDYKKGITKRKFIPPRLYDNLNSGYADIYNWSDKQEEIIKWINNAAAKIKTHKPDNNRELLEHNKNSDCSQGW